MNTDRGNVARMAARPRSQVRQTPPSAHSSAGPVPLGITIVALLLACGSNPGANEPAGDAVGDARNDAADGQTGDLDGDPEDSDSLDDDTADARIGDDSLGLSDIDPDAVSNDDSLDLGDSTDPGDSPVDVADVPSDEVDVPEFVCRDAPAAPVRGAPRTGCTDPWVPPRSGLPDPTHCECDSPFECEERGRACYRFDEVCTHDVQCPPNTRCTAAGSNSGYCRCAVPEVCNPICGGDSDCPPERYCREGRCVSRIRCEGLMETFCPDWDRCREGECRPSPAPDDDLACRTHADCSDGLVCMAAPCEGWETPRCVEPEAPWMLCCPLETRVASGLLFGHCIYPQRCSVNSDCDAGTCFDYHACATLVPM